MHNLAMIAEFQQTRLEVKTLVDEQQAAGRKTTSWDGTDEHGNRAASGIYFYRVKAGEFEDTKKMILMK